MRHAYCTYFDSHYLARGLTMLRSLREREQRGDIYVLALDDECARMVDAAMGGVRIISLADLHAREPGLAALRGRRTTWAFYATHKPVLAKFILTCADRPDTLTFLDADLWLFSDLSAVRDEVGTASIGLSPHRFHSGSSHLARYGKYNAGFIYWRNDATALRALEEWRQQCLEWCDEDARPDGRFMNQGYLNDWPDGYGGVHVIAHPGVNLAPWNLDAHLIRRVRDQVLVDDHPLVFFHFSGLVRTEKGWYSRYPHDIGRFEAAHEAIYAPYLAALKRESAGLRDRGFVSGLSSVRNLKPDSSGVQLRDWPVRLTREPVGALKTAVGPIMNFVGDDAAIPRLSWPFDEAGERAGLTQAEIQADGSRYFSDLLPAGDLSGARVLDAGSGTGRVARYLAGLAAFVDVAQPFGKASLAACTVHECPNVRVARVDLDDLPYASGSFDIVLCLAAPRAASDVQAAIARLVPLLRPGGLLYLYLRHSLDASPWLRRALFGLALRTRQIVCMLPGAFRSIACDAIAVLVYLPFLALAAILREASPRKGLYKRIPFNRCLGKTWPYIRKHARESFGTPPERRFSRREITELLTDAGLIDIRFGDSPPRWRALGRKIA